MVNEGAPSAKGSTWDDVRVRESSALTMTHDVRYSPPRALVQDVADPRGPRPKRVSTAMRILWASFVLGTPSSVYQLAREPEWLVVVFMLLITVLVILLYLKIGAGRNWARIVLAVLQAVGVPALAMPVEPFPLAVQVLDWSCLALGMIALWLLCTGESVSWFRPARVGT